MPEELAAKGTYGRNRTGRSRELHGMMITWLQSVCPSIYVAAKEYIALSAFLREVNNTRRSVDNNTERRRQGNT